MEAVEAAQKRNAGVDGRREAILVSNKESWTIRIDIPPFAAPRQSSSDKWKKRPVVARYREWKDRMRAALGNVGWELGNTLDIEFHIPMPAHWSRKKRGMMVGRPHQQRPDLDNLVKAIMDLSGKDDGHVYAVAAKKAWSEEGFIVIREPN